jgi:cytochrome P450
MVVQPDVCSIHRSKELWGDDAEEFRPQRWLNTDASSPTRGLAQQQWLAFGVGARRCLGERLAYAEAKLVLAVLLHSYVIEKSGRSEVGWTSLGSPQRGLASSVFQPQLRLFGPNVLSPRLLFLVVKER